MSYALLKRVNVELLHPGLVNRAVEMLSACRAAGFDYWAVSGFRRPEEQLSGMGHAQLDPIVFNGHLFQCAHHFGLAIDFLHARNADGPGLEVGWDPEEYAELGWQARAHDLLWGGDFSVGGRMHVQLPGVATSADLDRLRAVYLAAPGWGGDARSRERSKLQEVWRQMDVGDAAFV